MHRSFNIVATLFFALVLVTGCLIMDTNDIKTAQGTVKYINLEGGFYGIITDEDKHLDPMNLSNEFKVDGKRVRFDYTVPEEQASFHMWGTIIVIKSIIEIE